MAMTTITRPRTRSTGRKRGWASEAGNAGGAPAASPWTTTASALMSFPPPRPRSGRPADSSSPPAPRQRRLRLEAPRILGDDVAAAPVHPLVELGAAGLERLERGVAQGPDPGVARAQHLDARRALAAPEVVLRCDERVLHAAVADRDQVLAERQRHLLVRERAAVEEDRVSRPRYERDEGVHDPDFYPDELVLRFLADAREPRDVHREAEERAGSDPGRHLERGGRGEACPLRQVPAERKVHPRKRDPGAAQRPE